MRNYFVYIPHSSDKTFTSNVTSTSSPAVYIPHSSDKTTKKQKPTPFESVFTSLIVQIKRKCFLTLCCFHLIVYIPHSSDKTYLCELYIEIVIIVYIPHSSDKT